MISAGSPRSVSKRANASKGDDVSTPPKSQITASIINLCPAHLRPAASMAGVPTPARVGLWLSRKPHVTANEILSRIATRLHRANVTDALGSAFSAAPDCPPQSPAGRIYGLP